jgi:hypothetical protein
MPRAHRCRFFTGRSVFPEKILFVVAAGRTGSAVASPHMSSIQPDSGIIFSFMKTNRKKNSQTKIYRDTIFRLCYG